MDSLQSYDPPSPTLAQRLAHWRMLPWLLVSRRWRWMTLGVIVLAVGMIQLGFWQLDRLQQRRAHNAILESRVNGLPIQLTGQPIDIDANEFRRVVVRGEYDSQHEVMLRNRSWNGSPGMDILTPLRITGTDQTVLINRGWVPLLETEREQRTQFQVTGPVEIEGVLRKPQTRTSSLSPRDPEPVDGRLDAWFRVDIDRIEEQVPYPLEPYYIEQLPVEGAPMLPHPQPNINYHNEGSHLNYAIQWFSFTTILLVGYAALVVTRTREEHEQAVKTGA